MCTFLLAKPVRREGARLKWKQNEPASFLLVPGSSALSYVFYFFWVGVVLSPTVDNERNSSTAHTHTHTSIRGTNQTHFHLKRLNNISIKQPGHSQTRWQWRGDKPCGCVSVLPSKIRLSDDATSPHDPFHQWGTQTSWWAAAQWKMRALHVELLAALFKQYEVKQTKTKHEECICMFMKYSAKAN